MLESIAQGVLIGDGAGSGNNALLEISSSDKGVLVPKMTSAQKMNILNPANGLMVYDTDKHSFYYYNSRSGWVQMKPVASGTITMWYGDVATYFPGGLGTGHMKGWAICDGNGNRPNLGARFVLGGEANDAGAIGGSATVAVSVSQIPSHTHAVSDPGHSHSGALAANTSHSHVVNYSNSGSSPSYAVADDGTNFTYNGNGTTTYEVASNDATYIATINATTTGITLQNRGGGQAHENRPPFYVLVYIIKL